MRSAIQPYPEAAYDALDQVLTDINLFDYSAAVTDLEAFWQVIGQPFNAADPLRLALQAGNRVAISNQLNLVYLPRFRRLCDTQRAAVTRLHVLRVASSGAASDLVVQAWNGTQSGAFTASLDFPGYVPTSLQAGRRPRSQQCFSQTAESDGRSLSEWRMGIVPEAIAPIHGHGGTGMAKRHAGCACRPSSSKVQPRSL